MDLQLNPPTPPARSHIFRLIPDTFVDHGRKPSEAARSAAIEGDLAQLASMMAKTPDPVGVTHVELEENVISVEIAIKIAEQLSTYPNVQSFAIHGTGAEGEDMPKIFCGILDAFALSANKVTHINLAENAISNYTEIILSCLRNFPNLLHLNLGDSGLCAPGDKEPLGSVFGRDFGRVLKLESLVFSQTHVGSSAPDDITGQEVAYAIGLGSALQKNCPSLKYLKLDFTVLNPVGIEAIFGGWAGQSLEYLDITNANFTREGVYRHETGDTFTALIRNAKHLHTLLLTDVGIPVPVLNQILRSFPKDAAITKISFHNTSADASTIATCAAVFDSLRHLQTVGFLETQVDVHSQEARSLGLRFFDRAQPRRKLYAHFNADPVDEDAEEEDLFPSADLEDDENLDIAKGLDLAFLKEEPGLSPLIRVRALPGVIRLSGTLYDRVYLHLSAFKIKSDGEDTILPNGFSVSAKRTFLDDRRGFLREVILRKLFTTWAAQRFPREVRPYLIKIFTNERALAEFPVACLMSDVTVGKSLLKARAELKNTKSGSILSVGKMAEIAEGYFYAVYESLEAQGRMYECKEYFTSIFNSKVFTQMEAFESFYDKTVEKLDYNGLVSAHPRLFEDDAKKRKIGEKEEAKKGKAGVGKEANGKAHGPTPDPSPDSKKYKASTGPAACT